MISEGNNLNETEPTPPRVGLEREIIKCTGKANKWKSSNGSNVFEFMLALQCSGVRSENISANEDYCA